MIQSRHVLAFCAAMLMSVAAQPVAAGDKKGEGFRITFVGQSMIRGDVRSEAPEAFPTIKALVNGDLAFTNFEASVLDETKPEAPKLGRFLSPPETLDALKSLGFNLLSLANNHSNDLGVTGIMNTIEHSRRLGLAHAGTGENLGAASAPYYFKTPKGTVALIAVASGLIKEGSAATETRPGVHELKVIDGVPDAVDAERILSSIKAARARADLVVVSHHNHVFDVHFRTALLSQLPERLKPPKWLESWTRREVDAGADVISMHGAPFMHGVEVYKGKAIFYDLGNFIFQVPPSTYWLEEPIAWESVVADVQFDGRNLKSVTFTPIGMNKIGKGQPDVHDEHANNQYLRTRGLPSPATGVQAHYILQRLVEFSKPFGTEIIVDGTTATLKLPESPDGSSRPSVP